MASSMNMASSLKTPIASTSGAAKPAVMMLGAVKQLPRILYSCEASRQLEHVAIEKAQIPGIVLMKRAARASFHVLMQKWAAIESITVLCGGGNNGGDGYVVAAIAQERGLSVSVRYLADPEGLKGDAKLAYDYACREGVSISRFQANCLTDLLCRDLIIDAMLGSGLRGVVRDDYQDAIDQVNHSAAPVLALDIPSGLCGDTGSILGAAIKAEATVTFIAVKQGLLTARAPVYVGELLYAGLDVPQDVFSEVQGSVHRLSMNDLLGYLPEREADAHKGDFGHCMVIGGDYGYGGAAILAAESVLNSGAGLTSLASQPTHVAPALVRNPEIMALGVVSGQELEPHLSRPSVVVIGPGLGQSPWSEQMFLCAYKAGLPMVVDADGLNLLATRFRHRAPRDNWILTPHPGEAARLLKCDIEKVQADRFQAATDMQRIFGGVVVLKGAGTIIADGSSVYLANVGNPGMASGGSGDVLAGLLGALLAQGLSPTIAAQLGVCLHGSAGDLAAEDSGQRGLTASSVIPYIREWLN